ncbi:MAG TPA: MFS transporter, partial [Aeromicrobium sp.]
MTTDRWRLLVVVVGVQSVGTWLSNAPLFLIAHLHLEHGMSLPRAGFLASTTLVGTMLTLVAWGALVDRIGERRGLTLGMVIATAAGLTSAVQSSPTGLAITWFLIGVGTASLNSSSGRLIVGWFPPNQRGTAMGIRQTALPLGIGLAALTAPVLAETRGLSVALLVPSLAGLVACAAVALFVIDPPRPEPSATSGPGPAANPYRQDRQLVRVHLASALLVVPQITVWTFIVVWLIDARG